MIEDREGSDDIAELRAALRGGDAVFVRWTPEAARVPQLAGAVAAFRPLPHPAARACTQWLREHALAQPQESVPWLLLGGGRMLGFYALANGQAELSRRDRTILGARRRTQPAVLLTQIARAEDTEGGTGRTLVLHAIATARKAAAYSAATVLALDPYDAPTSEMWRTRYEFRPSASAGLGRRSDLARLWQPLRTRDGAA